MLFRRVSSIEPGEAAAALTRGELQIVDVREHEELAQAAVEGALHIPLGELPGRFHELGTHRRVAFLCRSGGRSALATRAAANAGIDAANVEGGIEAWAGAGLPLTPGGRGGAP
jgi:rhodanese-related sulfurtransferase